MRLNTSSAPVLFFSILAFVLAGAGCRYLPSEGLKTDAGKDARQSGQDEQAAASTELQKQSERRADGANTKGMAARLQRARTLLRNGKNGEALQLLQSMSSSESGDGLGAEQVKSLLDEAESADPAIEEVQDRMALPQNYGQTATISRDTESIATPPGPMEELIKRKVTLHLDEASVPSIVFKLSEIEGLNIIADQALTQQGPGGGGNQLTLHVEGVPLKEVLSYIARNMGIAFHLGENVIWVTEAEDQERKGPELKTKIYPLRSGFVPQSGGNGDAGGGSSSDGIGGTDFSSSAGGASGMGLFGDGDSSSSEMSSSTSGSEDAELYTALQMTLSGGPEEAFFKIFKKRNMLLVRDTRERLETVEKLLQKFDRVPKQILIEARFLTISQNDLKELGMELERLEKQADGDLNEALETLLVQGRTVPQEAQGSGTLGIQISGILGSQEYEALLHVLQEYGQARTLSAPRVTVMNNEQAKIHRGKTDYFYVVEDFDLESTGGENPSQRVVPTGNIEEFNFGITLVVKASVGRDASDILLALNPQIKTFLKEKQVSIPISDLQADDQTDGDQQTGDGADSTPTVGKTTMPIFRQNNVNTTAVVQNNETVVLGGMISNRRETRVNKVPLLADIPLIGHLFRYKKEALEPEHLIIFVNARLVDPSGKYVEYEE